MHINSLALLLEYGIQYMPFGGRILEIAPDEKRGAKRAIMDFVPAAWDEYIGEPTYRYPFGDGIYDVVLSLNVAEHVPLVWDWMREQARLCRRGGHVIMVCPVTRRYHEDPVDCWRIYPEGGLALLQYAGLKPILALSKSYKDGVLDTIVIGEK